MKSLRTPVRGGEKWFSRGWHRCSVVGMSVVWSRVGWAGGMHSPWPSRDAPLLSVVLFAFSMHLLGRTTQYTHAVVSSHQAEHSDRVTVPFPKWVAIAVPLYTPGISSRVHASGSALDVVWVDGESVVAIGRESVVVTSDTVGSTGPPAPDPLMPPLPCSMELHGSGTTVTLPTMRGWYSQMYG